ncbi:MAG: 8-oxo-dGTP diphosphatase [Oscillospiraceae bacterium]|nr:8-oxo-dGTP diphosphatase [Oscillospiraceae bacterium]
MLINSTLCYLEKEGSYLMLHRTKKQGDVNRDKWIGVGGKFEANESPFDCVKRETLEETGLTLKAPQYRGVVTFITDSGYYELMHLFTCTDFEGEITSCDEGDLEWVKFEKIPELPIWQGDKIFFKLLAENEPFFSLKLVYQGDTLEEAVLNDTTIL